MTATYTFREFVREALQAAPVPMSERAVGLR